jgi:lambda family phage portal protein
MGVFSWLRNYTARAKAESLSFDPMGRRAFDSARLNRLSYDLRAGTTSADSEIRGSLRVLWDRARKLARDNPYAVQAKRTTMVNIVGASGVRLRPRVYRLNDDRQLDERRNKLIAKAWQQWCRADSCDVAGKLSFHGFEMMAAGALPESGEAIWRIWRRPFGKSKVPLGLQMIESDMLDLDYTGKSDGPGRRWRMGIEVDDFGRPLRYAILTQHPGDFEFPGNRDSRKHEFVDARDIIHFFVPSRVSQSRGYPGLAPVLLTAHNLDEYEKAHWTRKRVQASQLGWIVPADGSMEGDEVVNGQNLWNTEPGSYNTLNAGDQVIPPSFGPDDREYDNVVRNLLRRTASGFGASYETISKDFSQTNYSSSRLSILEDREWWKVLQSWLIQTLHQRVYEEFVEAAVLSGALPIGLFADYWRNPDRYTAPRWQARTWAWVDPSKELDAIRTARELMLETHAQQIHGHSGEEFEDVMSQIAAENEIKIELDLIPDPEDLEPPDPAEPSDPEETEEATEEATEETTEDAAEDDSEDMTA